MRIIDCEQGSEAWDNWRNRPTASCFHKFITPSRCEYSKQAKTYACEIVAKRRNLYTVDFTGSAWTDHGHEFEDSAVLAYEKQFGVTTTKVGFVLSDLTDAFGGSPDRLVNVTHRDDKHSDCDGVLEIKCPKAETLMEMHLDPTKAEMYSKPQVQGLLLITRAKWLDFFCFHPDLEPYHERFLPDEGYQAKIAEHLLTFLDEIKRVESSIKPMKHELVSVPTSGPSDVKWD